MTCRWAPFATDDAGHPLTWACVYHGRVAPHVSLTCRDLGPLGGEPPLSAFAQGPVHLAEPAVSGK